MYRENDRILLVGEGDFSFSLCLATRFGSASNMVATSLNSKEGLLVFYSKAKDNLQELENLGCKILHEVDAHTMSEHACLKMEKFDRIVFNFPHAGFPCREKEIWTISCHRELVRGFLKNAKELLAYNGQVHVTHKTAYPFYMWGIVDLAQGVGLKLISEVSFYLHNYPGYQNKKGSGSFCYQNKKGSGSFCDDTFPVGACSTYQFSSN